ncbi:hypothetical protein QR680_008965 [Steinernema hermaphroditum]|uniref:Innexin n=1 Tax=Steinernema hermaphroditum TaxID=289476 RepID=A0AA39M914_9BILA|nr:hypothetical protein QR680_008965 [Steinernema hermaphroditum]
MNRFSNLIETIAKPRFEEDSIDRLNYKITTFISIGAAFTIFSKEYWGDPISCWTSAQFPGAWVQYTRDICFIENTYYVPPDRAVPNDIRERESRALIYYQWVPFILILQALLYNAPHIFWRMLNWTSGLQVRSIVTMAHEASKKSHEEAKEERGRIVNHLHAGFRAKMRFVPHSSPLVFVMRCVTSLLGDSYLTVIYITTKILFILINSLQFVFLAAFVGGGDRWWGWHITAATLRGETWRETGLFPRITMCDFKINQDNKTVMQYSVQCVLSANMLNEKLFVFLWWWALFLEVTTITNLIFWIFVLHHYPYRRDFIRDLIVASKHRRDSRQDEAQYLDQLDGFVNDYVKRDGILVLRLMVSNSGEIVTSEIVASLFARYKEWKKQGRKEDILLMRQGDLRPFVFDEDKNSP